MRFGHPFRETADDLMQEVFMAFYRLCARE